jgi:hypothetical protein
LPKPREGIALSLLSATKPPCTSPRSTNGSHASYETGERQPYARTYWDQADPREHLGDAHGLDERSIVQAVTAVTQVLASRGHLTRAQLAAQLRERGIRGSGQMLMTLLAHAELDGLICSGRLAEGEHTYALMDERAPTRRRLGRTEALAEIALRYFTGHGPATERDLAYWATLSLTDVRAGLQQVRDRLGSFQYDGRTFWHHPGEAPSGPQQPAGHLLQILDETYRGYQDSRWVLDAAGDVPRARRLWRGWPWSTRSSSPP